MISKPNKIVLDRSDSLIRVKQQKIAANKYIPTQIIFELKDKDLNDFKILKKQSKKVARLNLSPELLADIRYYSLVQNIYSLEPKLSFTTYYFSSQQKIAAIQTTISLQGKTSQKISRKLLSNYHLLNELFTTHYWLIEEICDRLSLRYQNKNSLLEIVLSLVISMVISSLLFYIFKLNIAVAIIGLIVIFFIAKIVTKILINKYLASFILQQLLIGFFSKNTAKRHLGFILLRYFG